MYFVVKVDGTHVVWEMTPKQMYTRVNAESELLNCLDQSPFATRVEAEQRRNILNEDARSERLSKLADGSHDCEVEMDGRLANPTLREGQKLCR